MIAYLRQMNAPAGVVRMQEAVNWMAMPVTTAQLAEAPEPPVVADVEPPRRYAPRALPPVAPGFIELPGGRIAPCLLMVIGLPVCI
jgi:hypothetical protein